MLHALPLLSARFERGVIEQQGQTELYQDGGEYATDRRKSGGKENVEICRL
jgi:hypothetical protein